MKKIKYIVIHCTVSEFGDAEVITGWHKERGFRTIGYNAVILNGYRKNTRERNYLEDGQIEEGRGMDLNAVIDPGEQGAHVLDYNAKSLGIAVIGDKMFTFKQLTSLIYLLRTYQAVIPGVLIVGHYELPTANGKTCPNMDMDLVRKAVEDRELSPENAVRKYLNKYLSNPSYIPSPEA